MTPFLPNLSAHPFQASYDEVSTVSLFFKGIPSGVRPEDNEAGTRESLEKLARYVEQEVGR
ncbi:hypothetical protein ccbrp13_34080 [Ktedonobacteria bacterium brp13]|nr:hypothetical protein ccbrp13_34080 [Ktedonobacteria bacterium brp13]